MTPSRPTDSAPRPEADFDNATDERPLSKSADQPSRTPRSEPLGLLPVSARGKHELEAALRWVVACGNYNEYGCMPTEVRDYIVAVLNAAPPQPAAPPLDYPKGLVALIEKAKDRSYSDEWIGAAFRANLSASTEPDQP